MAFALENISGSAMKNVNSVAFTIHLGALFCFPLHSRGLSAPLFRRLICQLAPNEVQKSAFRPLY